MLFSYIAAKVRLIEAQAKLIELQIEVATKNLAKQAEQEAAALKAIAEREVRAAAFNAKQAAAQAGQVTKAVGIDIANATKTVVSEIKKEL